MSEQPKEVPKKEEVPKEESPKKETCKKECPKFPWFHGFGPRCHGKKPFCHPHKHKERKCECGEVIPKRKEGEPKIKVCPKCGKDLPKKEHGFGMRCHKMKKFMKYMWMMKMHRGTQFGPKCFGLRQPPFPKREMQVHHYIHLGPPHHHFGIPPMGMGRFGRFPMMAPGFCRTSMGPGFGRPPMGPGFGKPPMGPGFGRPPMGPGFWRFGRLPMGPRFGRFGRPPMGPLGFGRPPFGFPMGPCGKEGHHGPFRHHHPKCEKPPCEKKIKDEKKEETPKEEEKKE